jgi:hypothetical protein
VQEALEVLILVVNDRCATLCSNCNGVTHFIRSVKGRCPKVPCELREGADYVGRDVGAKRMFARELIAMLEHDVDDHQYEGVIILADESIDRELRQIGPTRLSHLLIAHLIDPPARCREFSFGGLNAGPHTTQ